VTPRVSDEQVLEFIEEFVDSNGYAPSVRDVMEAMDVVSPSTAYSRLKKLRKQGRIDWADDRSRTIRIIQPMEVALEQFNRLIRGDDPPSVMG
jgi:repressor LexA